MNAYLKSLSWVALVVAVVFLASVPAQAYSVTFQEYNSLGNTTDGSGLTSQYATNANNNPLGSFEMTIGGVLALFDPSTETAYFTETFDVAGETPHTVTVGGGGTVTFESAGGGFSSILDPLNELYSTGTAGVRVTTVSYAAAPAGDTTNFAFIPGHNGALPTSMQVLYGPEISAGQYISYMGLYVGSIDTYNSLTFYNLADSPIFTITGQNLLDIFHGTSGNQTAPASNLYINIAFNSNENFSSFSYDTSGVAFESDNLVTGLSLSPVPEPTTMLLLGFGLVGLAAARRKFKK